MRLIDVHTLAIKQFGHATGTRIPIYAILSHTWEDGEVSFQDMTSLSPAVLAQRAGYRKIQGACARANQEGYRWIWVDTCCIDKRNGPELAEALDSMYSWYQRAAVCYVYLSDAVGSQPVYRSDNPHTADGRTPPRWYTRGWTLQEMLAPTVVKFYNRQWIYLGDKREHGRAIAAITGVEMRPLLKGDLTEISVARRMAWLAKRVTTKVEDMAYCMLGICEVKVPMHYGDSYWAFVQLQLAIVRHSNDQSVFAWRRPDALDDYREDRHGVAYPYEKHGVFAPTPQCFNSSLTVTLTPLVLMGRGLRYEAIVDNSHSHALRVHFLLGRDTAYPSGEVFLAVLDCLISTTPGVMAGIRLRRQPDGTFVRVDSHILFEFAVAVPQHPSHPVVDNAGFDVAKPQDALVDIRSHIVYRHWEPKWVFVSR